MKYFVALCAFLALTHGAAVQSRDFQDEVEDFLTLIGELSFEKIFGLMEEYNADEEYLKTMDWLLTADFDGLLTEMESIPEFNAVIDFLEGVGVDAREIISILHEGATGGDRKTRTAAARLKTGTGFSGYLNDLREVLPHEELHALFNEKMDSDPEFQAIVNALRSEEYSEKWDALFAQSEFNKELNQLKEHGIDVWLLIDIVLQIFGADEQR